MSRKKTFSIVKSSGELQRFAKQKYLSSLKKSGANKQQADNVYNRILNQLREGISTRKIHSLTSKYLRQESQRIAHRYNLKKAIQELGPDGYTFEKFVSKVLAGHGYSVKLNQMCKGKCVSHEVDIIAENRKNIYIECKFHHKISFKNDIKTALYIYARYLDLKRNINNKLDEFWIVSNTKYSKDAVEYAQCVGLKLIGPNFPEKEGLCHMVMKKGIHPITSVSQLSRSEKSFLIAKGIVTVKDLLKNRSVLVGLGLSQVHKDKILRECRAIGELK